MIILYVFAIVLANVLTSSIPPLDLFGVLIPPGTLMIGFTFIARDFVQLEYGRNKTYGVILIALSLSAASTYVMGNGVTIVIASALSFLVSEVMDTEVFTRWKGTLAARVGVSGTIGSILDSAVFTFVAGFPIGAMYGQLLVKLLMQGTGAVILRGRNKE